MKAKKIHEELKRGGDPFNTMGVGFDLEMVKDFLEEDPGVLTRAWLEGDQETKLGTLIMHEFNIYDGRFAWAPISFNKGAYFLVIGAFQDNNAAANAIFDGFEWFTEDTFDIQPIRKEITAYKDLGGNEYWSGQHHNL